MMKDPIKASGPANDVVVQKKLPMLTDMDGVGIAGIGGRGGNGATHSGAEEYFDKTWRGYHNLCSYEVMCYSGWLKTITTGTGTRFALSASRTSQRT
jgi:hypothetical protein